MGFILTVNPVQGSYDGMTGNRSWILRIHSVRKPSLIRVNGQRRPFEFDAGKKVTTVMAGRFIKSKKTEVGVYFE